MSRMQRPGFRQIGFLALVLAAVFILPTSAPAADKVDPDQTLFSGCDKVLNIHGAIVRVRFINQKLYIGVKSGSLDFKLPNGKILFTAPAGRVLLLGPVKGTPVIGGVTFDPTAFTQLWASGFLLGPLGQQFIVENLSALIQIPIFGPIMYSYFPWLGDHIVGFTDWNFAHRIGPYLTFE